MTFSWIISNCVEIISNVFKVEREKERRGSDDDDDDEKFTELQRNEDEKIRLDGLKMAPKKEAVKLDKSGLFKKPSEPSKKSGKSESSGGEKRKMTALEEIMKEEEERKKKQVIV